MSTQFTSKFNTHLPIIREAIEGKDDLRQNRKLYKKIYKYFKDKGISFTGDDSYDYETVLECIYEVIWWTLEIGIVYKSLPGVKTSPGPIC